MYVYTIEDSGGEKELNRVIFEKKKAKIFLKMRKNIKSNPQVVQISCSINKF